MSGLKNLLFMSKELENYKPNYKCILNGYYASNNLHVQVSNFFRVFKVKQSIFWLATEMQKKYHN